MPYCLKHGNHALSYTVCRVNSWHFIFTIFMKTAWFVNIIFVKFDIEMSNQLTTKAGSSWKFKTWIIQQIRENKPRSSWKMSHARALDKKQLQFIAVVTIQWTGLLNWNTGLLAGLTYFWLIVFFFRWDMSVISPVHWLPQLYYSAMPVAEACSFIMERGWGQKYR